MTGGLWTLNKLAAELGRDRRSLGRLLEGLEPAEVEEVGSRTTRRWRLRDVVNHLIRAATSAEGELDLDQQRARLAAAQSERVERENAVKAGEFAHVDDVKRVWEGAIVAARAHLLGLPNKLSVQLINISDAAVIHERLRVEIYYALTELSRSEDPEPPDDSDHVADPPEARAA